MSNGYKKKKININMKINTWDEWIGIEIGKSTCFSCARVDIYQSSFVAGHVIAESNGGDTNIFNLRPICVTCNSSMGTTNMYDYMITNGINPIKREEELKNMKLQKRTEYELKKQIEELKNKNSKLYNQNIKLHNYNKQQSSYTNQQAASCAKQQLIISCAKQQLATSRAKQKLVSFKEQQLASSHANQQLATSHVTQKTVSFKEQQLATSHANQQLATSYANQQLATSHATQKTVSFKEQQLASSHANQKKLSFKEQPHVISFKKQYNIISFKKQYQSILYNELQLVVRLKMLHYKQHMGLSNSRRQLTKYIKKNSNSLSSEIINIKMKELNINNLMTNFMIIKNLLVRKIKQNVARKIKKREIIFRKRQAKIMFYTVRRNL